MSITPEAFRQFSLPYHGLDQRTWAEFRALQPGPPGNGGTLQPRYRLVEVGSPAHGVRRNLVIARGRFDGSAASVHFDGKRDAVAFRAR